MQTRIYIDGYNLYYGCLKHTPYKWLDLKALFENQILPSVNHMNTQPVLADLGIKFFTAEIVEKAALDLNSKQDQNTYHNALENHCGDTLEIYKGYYAVNKVHMYQVENDKLPRECGRVEVWKLEEKQSDVNLATEALFDAMIEQELEQVVFVSNDTDLAASMRKISEYNPTRISKGWEPVRIGLVIPTRQALKEEDAESRRANKILSELANWTVKYIRSEWLENSQLPYKVRSGRRYATIPVSWHPEAEMLGLIMDELREVHTFGECWKWLETNKPLNNNMLDLTEITPIEVLHTPDGAAGVYEHAKAYRTWKRQLT